MNTRTILNTFLAVAFTLSAASLAQAQAPRTWVSGTGDDTAPCSRTAPCKTFSSALSKTVAGGEIDVLDPGSFGAVTITKSITINGDGAFAAILGSGINGIVVNAAATDVVTLRGLTINGADTGLNGIRFLSGAALFVENCEIFQFTQKGIDFQPTTNAQLFVKDTVIKNNEDANTGGGILIKPGAGANVSASLDRVRFERNLFGIRVEDRSDVTVRNSVAAGNTNNGFLAIATAAAAELNLEDCVTTGNRNGTNNSSGVQSNGSLATVRMSNVSVFNNNTGLLSASGGAILSFNNNRINGNDTNGASTQTVGQQ